MRTRSSRGCGGRCSEFHQPGHLTALAGVGPVAEDLPVHPASAEIATLAWSARRLSGDQLAHVLETARGMQQGQ
jgi:hypothetical protein